LIERLKDLTVDRLFRLDGRVAFISGAAGHLGQSMVEALAEAGAHVILNGRNQEPLVDLQRSLESRGLRASVAAFDVTDDSQLEEAFEEMGHRFARLDVLVNNAYSGSTGSIATATEGDFLDSYRVSVVAAFRCLRAAMPWLERAVCATGHASVINVSSMYGSVSPDPSIYGSSAMNNPPHYGAAKAALLQFTRYAAVHLAGAGIRVNAISPGPFPPADTLARNPNFADRLRSKVPLGRTGHRVELKGAILFLASDASTYVTGVDLQVDGGWTAW